MPDIRKPPLVFGEFRLDAANALLLQGESRVTLAPKPFEVLCLLVDRAGELVTKDEMLDVVWRNLTVSESSLSVAINAVRLALGDDPNAPRYVETAPRRGYRFIAEVSVAPPVATARSAASAREPDPVMRRRAGRVAQLAAVEQRLDVAAGQRRQITFVTGEAGIGKSTLLEMLTDKAQERGFGVMWARCIEQFGGGEAFLPLVEALQESCSGAQPLLSRESLENLAPTWLAQMPSLLDLKDREALRQKTFGATRERMLREFCELIEHISAAPPLLLIVEDMHWGDYATLDALSLFAQRQQPAAVAVLVSYRPGDVLIGAHPIRTVHQELQIRGRCTEIALGRLSVEEVAQYLRLRFGDADVIAALTRLVFERTNGQPLFMVSLVDYLVARGQIFEEDGALRLAAEESIAGARIPDNLREMIGRQIDRMSLEEQKILEAASAVGVEFSAAIVATIVDATIPAVERCCELLARRGQVLTPCGAGEWPDGVVAGRYQFIHSLYQEILYERLGPGERIDIHKRIGDRLEQAYGASGAEIATVLALHFEKGRDVARAVQYLQLAAEGSRKRFGNREAEIYLTRALNLIGGLPSEIMLPLRTKLLQRRARVRTSSSDDIENALSDMFAVVSSSVEAGQKHAEILGLLQISQYALFVDRNLCLESVNQALERSAQLDDAQMRTLVVADHALANLVLNGWDETLGVRYAEAIAMMLKSDDSRVVAHGLGVKAGVEIVRSNYRDCLDASGKCVALARARGDAFLFSAFSILHAWCLLHLGSWRALRLALPEALGVMEKNANRRISNTGRYSAAWLNIEALDFEGAKARCAQSGKSPADENDFSYFLGKALLARAHLGLGDAAAARAQLDAIQQHIEVDGVMLDAYCAPVYLETLAEYWLATGDMKLALQHARDLLDFVKRAPERNYLARAHDLLARIALREDDTSAAQPHVVEALQIVENVEIPLAAWRVFVTAAKLADRLGETSSAGAYRARAKAVVDALLAELAEDDPLHASLRAGFDRVCAPA